MAFGSVNVPGVSAKDLEDVRTIAEAAKSTAKTAVDTAAAAKSAVENLNKQIEEGGGIGGGSGSVPAVFAVGTTPPTDTKLLWIDTTEGAEGLKYYNGEAWKAVPVIWG